MSDITMGSLYDFNKAAILTQDPLTNEELTRSLYKIRLFCRNTMNRYYMLLNRETYNFTLFDFGEWVSSAKLNEFIYNDLKECLQNRGKVVSIEDKDDAYEIWIVTDDNEALVYYFFPYDEGVIN